MWWASHAWTWQQGWRRCTSFEMYPTRLNLTTSSRLADSKSRLSSEIYSYGGMAPLISPTLGTAQPTTLCGAQNILVTRSWWMERRGRTSPSPLASTDSACSTLRAPASSISPWATPNLGSSKSEPTAASCRNHRKCRRYCSRLPNAWTCWSISQPWKRVMWSSSTTRGLLRFPQAFPASARRKPTPSWNSRCGHTQPPF